MARGIVCKMMREVAYGDKSLRSPRKYATMGSGQVVCTDPERKRYKGMKKMVRCAI